MLDLDDGDPTGFQTTEVFATALGVRTLSGTGSDFLTAAVDFANTQLLGTLGATVIIDPKTERKLSRAIDELLEPDYGSKPTFGRLLCVAAATMRA